MKQITINGKELSSPKALHATLKTAMPFSEYYGENLDALYDALTEISEPICLAVENSEDAKAFLGEYWLRFIEVVSDADTVRLLLM